jgi:hypothetical protein
LQLNVLQHLAFIALAAGPCAKRQRGEQTEFHFS